MNSVQVLYPFTITPKRSLFLLLLFAIIYFGALVIVSVLTFPLWLKLFLIILTVMHGVWIIRRYALNGASNSVRALHARSKDDWVITEVNGSVAPVTIGSKSVITRFISILALQRNGSTKTTCLILVFDNSKRAERRRLQLMHYVNM